MRSASSLSALHQSILQAWEGAFANTPIIYLSGPITTGRRFVERIRSGLEPKAFPSILHENSADLQTVAERLRRERREVVLEPASLNVVEWSQKDYMALWDRLIERHVRLMLFMPGWEYSAGCALEYARAIEHNVRTESVSGAPITVVDAIALLTIAYNDIRNEDGSHHKGLVALADQLAGVVRELEARVRPEATVTNLGSPRKDESLNFLADTMNVAQFISFSPTPRGPKQEFSRIAGEPQNSKFTGLRAGLEKLLRASGGKSINVRSYEPSSPQSREFIYGLTNVEDAVAAIRRLTQEGLNTIVNETIDVNDGGVSGVLMGNVLEFAPDDTPRCVEKPGTASLPRGWGRDLLSSVYGFPVSLDTPLASRLEFSIHPRPSGWRQTHVLAWEYAEQPYVDARPQMLWPNHFSRLIGDKTFGLLVAHHIGLPVPLTNVISRRVAPFSFGQGTDSGETWIRTAPNEQAPGKYTTHRGWLDPFQLLRDEDPEGKVLMSVLAQHGVSPMFSGALIVGGDGALIVEGKRGEGESFMLGLSGPEKLPRNIELDVRALYERARAAIGVVRFEWVHDGKRAWIVQLHSGATETTFDYITKQNADHWQTFDIGRGLEALRRLISTLPPGTGIVLSGRVGLTSHFADVIRRANVPARFAKSLEAAGA